MKPFHSFLFPRIRKVNANFRNGGVLSAIVKPLTNLLHKHREFQWSLENETAFLKVKGILTHHPVLTVPDFTKPFKLAVDAIVTSEQGQYYFKIMIEGLIIQCVIYQRSLLMPKRGTAQLKRNYYPWHWLCNI